MWSGVAAQESLPKPFVVRSIRIGGTKPSSLVPSATLSISRHIGQRFLQQHRVLRAPRAGLAPPPLPSPILWGRDGRGAATNRHK